MPAFTHGMGSPQAGAADTEIGQMKGKERGPNVPP